VKAEAVLQHSALREEEQYAGLPLHYLFDAIPVVTGPGAGSPNWR
jgi:hypothetical protein